MPDNGQENGVNGASAEKRKAEEESNGEAGAKKEKLEGGTLLWGMWWGKARSQSTFNLRCLSDVQSLFGEETQLTVCTM